MSNLPPPGDTGTGSGSGREAHDDDAACWQAAKQLRTEFPDWVIIWVAHKRQFRAYPLFRTRREVDVSAAEPADLAAQMNEVEQAIPDRHPRSGDQRH